MTEICFNWIVCQNFVQINIVQRKFVKQNIVKRIGFFWQNILITIPNQYPITKCAVWMKKNFSEIWDEKYQRKLISTANTIWYQTIMDIYNTRLAEFDISNFKYLFICDFLGSNCMGSDQMNPELYHLVPYGFVSTQLEDSSQVSDVSVSDQHQKYQYQISIKSISIRCFLWKAGI